MTTNKARHLRNNPTEAELTLWRHVRYRQMDGHKFRRQRPIGPYIVDFVCLEQGLVIEIDGGHHASQTENGSVRTQSLESQGFRVLRFWNKQVLQEIDGVKAAILGALNAPAINPHPNLPPVEGEGT